MPATPKKVTADVDVHHLVVIGLGDVPERCVRFDAGVVDQNVDLPEFGDSILDQLGHCGGRAHIGVKQRPASPGGRHFGQRFFGGLDRANVVDGDVGAFARKALRDAAPDALAAAGNQRGLSLEALTLRALGGGRDAASEHDVLHPREWFLR